MLSHCARTIRAHRLLLCLILAAPLVLAQDVQMVPDKQDRDSAAKAQADKDKSEEPDDRRPAETLKVNVNVVQLFFNVKDKKGGLIPSLPKDKFEVFEDHKPQTIKYFSAESDLPLTLGILIDASASQERVLDMEKEVGGSFLSQILRPKDMAFVMSFDVGVDLLQDFTGVRKSTPADRFTCLACRPVLARVRCQHRVPRRGHCSTMPCISRLTNKWPSRWIAKP